MAAKAYNTRGVLTTRPKVTLSCQWVDDLVHKSRSCILLKSERDSETGKVKVHYTGYGSNDDEWKDEDDIVDLSSRADLHAEPT